MEILLVLGALALLVGGVVAVSQPHPGVAGSVAEMLDFSPFTLTQGQPASVLLLAKAGLAPELVGQAVTKWGLQPLPGATATGVLRVLTNLPIPSAVTGTAADVWRVDALYTNPTATFTPKNEVDAIAPALAASSLSPQQLLASALVTSAISPLAGTIVTVPFRKVG